MHNKRTFAGIAVIAAMAIFLSHRHRRTQRTVTIGSTKLGTLGAVPQSRWCAQRTSPSPPLRRTQVRTESGQLLSVQHAVEQSPKPGEAVHLQFTGSAVSVKPRVESPSR